MERVPNVVELGRRPEDVRYVWIAYTSSEHGSEKLRQGSTWITLKRAIEELGEDTVVVIVDLVKLKAYQLEDPESFLDSWRPEYFNFDWEASRVIK